MKKIIASLLLFALLLSLAACGEPAPEESGWVYAYNQKGAITEQGYYYLIQGGYLRFTDFASGVTVTLCSKPGCLHDAEPSGELRELCEARIRGSFQITPLFFWNDSLYYVEEDAYGAQTYRRDAAGTGLEHVATLGEKYIEQQKSVTMYAYALSGGWLYYDANVYGYVTNEFEETTVGRESGYIGRLDLKTGKEEILYENAEEEVYLCGAKDDSFLIRVCARNNIDRDDPDRRQKWLAMPASLQRWDGETGEVTTLFESTIKDFYQVELVDGGTVHYMAVTDAGYVRYTYDLASGKTKKISQTTTRYLGDGYTLQLDSGNKLWNLYDRNMKQLSNELAAYSVNIRTMSEWGVVFSQRIEDPNGDQQVFCYVTYESLADGLQETDLLPFYTLVEG